LFLCFKQKCLCISIQLSRFEIVKYLIEVAKVDPDCPHFGFPALGYAAEGNKGETIKYLISFGANLNKPDSHYGWTPLHYSGYAGIEIWKLLISSGCDFRSKSKKGLTASESFSHRKDIGVYMTDIEKRCSLHFLYICLILYLF
jgi:ankyrin repeat protein